MSPDYRSWGRVLAAEQTIVPLASRVERPAALGGDKPVLAYGNGRSYGDSCLNDGGVLLATRGLDRFIAFDTVAGTLSCEAGVSFAEIIDLVLPQGWFLPVTPGTRFVTVGGAIANDVHGKNHHLAGTFGCHVEAFELLRSDGSVLLCTPEENAGLFCATIGGLGLTGLIRWARFRLKRVPGPWISGDSLCFGSLDEFFALSDASDKSWEYTVSWIDCVARGARLGRGIFMRGNHAKGGPSPPRDGGIPMPFTPPVSLVNRASLALFNRLYYARPAAAVTDARWHYEPFFYPLDGIRNWNRIYGPRGFYQYQCAIPAEAARQGVEALLRTIADTGQGSFLAVLKMFGARPSPGLMSFPLPGATLALDFPNGGAPTRTFLDRLEAITREHGGREYPAKDGRMSAAGFQQYFPAARAFAEFIDPSFSSSFWRRVQAQT